MRDSVFRESLRVNEVPSYPFVWKDTTIDNALPPAALEMLHRDGQFEERRYAVSKGMAEFHFKNDTDAPLLRWRCVLYIKCDRNLSGGTVVMRLRRFDPNEYSWQEGLASQTPEDQTRGSYQQVEDIVCDKFKNQFAGGATQFFFFVYLDQLRNENISPFEDRFEGAWDVPWNIPMLSAPQNPYIEWSKDYAKETDMPPEIQQSEINEDPYWRVRKLTPVFGDAPTHWEVIRRELMERQDDPWAYIERLIRKGFEERNFF